ncbi:hypothetical protein F4779DRAFT_643495 [Xylariaceae sp. FL0662B]|nr:hypothetical protein F4779DRAFT_643495 [Xylariaceae sp. FL0662B]
MLALPASPPRQICPREPESVSLTILRAVSLISSLKGSCSSPLACLLMISSIATTFARKEEISDLEKCGYYLPWILVGTVLTTIAYGLLSTLAPDTPVSKWIGYQVLFGVGCGMSTTTPFIAIQNLVPAAQISIAMGILIFCQNLGGAVFLIVAQTIFASSLRERVPLDAPGVNPELVISAGARSLCQLIPSNLLPGVLQAYSNSVDRVMFLGIGLGAASVLFAWGLGWRDIREKKGQEV